MQIGDVHFYRYLLSIGIRPKKSLTILSLQINYDYFRDFLRGVIDGDGNIATWIHKTNHSRQWCVRIYSGSLHFLIWLQINITKHFQIRGKLYKVERGQRDSAIYRLKYGKVSAQRLLKEVYYPGCNPLKRKALQAVMCVSMR